MVWNCRKYLWGRRKIRIQRCPSLRGNLQWDLWQQTSKMTMTEVTTDYAFVKIKNVIEELSELWPMKFQERSDTSATWLLTNLSDAKLRLYSTRSRIYLLQNQPFLGRNKMQDFWLKITKDLWRDRLFSDKFPRITCFFQRFSNLSTFNHSELFPELYLF